MSVDELVENRITEKNLTTESDDDVVINFYCKVVFRSREDCKSDERIVASSEAGYYVAYCDVGGKRKYAIFHENGRQISNWFDDVSWSGLVSGASKYYVARMFESHF